MCCVFLMQHSLINPFLRDVRIKQINYFVVGVLFKLFLSIGHLPALHVSIYANFEAVEYIPQ